MIICGFVEVFKGNSVQRELETWACILRKFKAREILLGEFIVMVINQVIGVNNIDQEGIEPVLMMVKDPG